MREEELLKIDVAVRRIRKTFRSSRVNFAETRMEAILLRMRFSESEIFEFFLNERAEKLRQLIA